MSGARARRSRSDLRAAAARAAEEFDGVLTMRRLGGLGYDHGAIAREVAAQRWLRQGRHTVALHTGALSDEARRWRAVWEVAEGVALLDGVTALRAARVFPHAGRGGRRAGRSWAVGDRQAALLLCLVAQQRLTTGPRLLEETGAFAGRARRALVGRVVLDLADGARSLGVGRVLRIDLVGMRLREADFMAQVRRGLHVDHGCV